MGYIINPFLVVPSDPMPPLDMQVWYRSDFEVELGGVPAVNGGLLDWWGDKSANGHEAIQPTMAQQPTYNEGVINGLPAINFPAATNQLMDIANGSSDLVPPTNTAFSLFAVLRPTDFASPMVLSQRNSAAGQVQWYIATSGKQIWSNGSESLPSDTSLTAAAWNRIGFIVPNHSTGNVTYYLNGAADGVQALGVSGGSGSSELVFMGNPPGFVFPFKGDVAEYLFYTREVTGSEVTQIDNYFTSRYAL